MDYSQSNINFIISGTGGIDQRSLCLYKPIAEKPIRLDKNLHETIFKRLIKSLVLNYYVWNNGTPFLYSSLSKIIPDISISPFIFCYLS